MVFLSSSPLSIYSCTFCTLCAVIMKHKAGYVKPWHISSTDHLSKYHLTWKFLPNKKLTLHKHAFYVFVQCPSGFFKSGVYPAWLLHVLVIHGIQLLFTIYWSDKTATTHLGLHSTPLRKTGLGIGYRRYRLHLVRNCHKGRQSMFRIFCMVAHTAPALGQAALLNYG
jgi:hypothetical protein